MSALRLVAESRERRAQLDPYTETRMHQQRIVAENARLRAERDALRKHRSELLVRFTAQTDTLENTLILAGHSKSYAAEYVAKSRDLLRSVLEAA